MTDVQKQFKSIPYELKVLPNWVCFTFEANPEGGKPRKVPYQINGVKASHSDPATWTSYTNCVAAVERGEFDTIGFAFKDTPYMGFDFDNCLDPETGILQPEAQEIVDRLCSYSEESISGTGIHILMKGSLPEGRRKSSPVLPNTEMYDTARFFVTTGEHWKGSPATIEERTFELAKLHSELFPSEPEKASAAPLKPNKLTEEEVIKRASTSNKKFIPLWSGDWQNLGYPSQSEADSALCSILAFWTGNDATKIDSLFRQSALYRKKWETTYYRNRTIQRAIEGTQATYSATHNSTPTTEQAEITVTPEAARVSPSPVNKVFDMLTNTRLSEMIIPPIEYFDEPFFIKNAITGITGEASAGKSTFVLGRLHEVANKHPNAMVIYCDADNPAAIAQERSERLRGKLEDRISYWGGFQTDADGHLFQPWDIESRDWPPLINRIKDTGKDPIIVFDTLNSFMNGQNENDNAVVGKIMNYMRAMTNCGATVIIIHHTGKSETSKESRGASAFKGGIDAGFVVESRIVDCSIQSMIVRPFKSRLGKTASFAFTMDGDGRLVLSAERPKESACLDFILQQQGKSRNQIETSAARSTHGFSRQLVRDTIDKYLLSTPPSLKKVKERIYGSDTEVSAFNQKATTHAAFDDAVSEAA